MITWRYIVSCILATSSLLIVMTWPSRADDVKDCNEKKGEVAIRACSRIIETGRAFGKPISKKNLAIVHYLRGSEYIGIGEYKRAVMDLSQAIEMDPGDADTYYLRGLAFRLQGDHERAILDFDRSIELKPGDALAYDSRGTAYRLKGDHERAIADYHKALELDPNMASARSALEELEVATTPRTRAKPLDRELADFEVCQFEGLIDAPDEYAIISACTALLKVIEDAGPGAAEKQRRYEQIRDAYAETLLNDRQKYELAMFLAAENYYEIYNIRAAAYVAVGEYEDAYRAVDAYERAMADYDAAIAIAPRYAPAYVGQGRVYLAQKNWNQAVAAFSQAINISPRHSGAYLGRGKAYSSSGDYRRAIADFDQSIRIYPKRAEAYEQRGHAYKASGDFGRAIADYSKAIEMNPKSMSAYLGRMDAYFARGDSALGNADRETLDKLMKGL